ncbi:sigma-54-dependent Fis family transcriptional regulator [Thermohalobacter berrensis]|uniref:Sigma-54-dependent Fis family transcriptional regulator n=1 Tax=Thermohalobacter berrensis TaxID=99594 RepID=A0A419SUF0_9FIRM|nr:sigma 54-interacting transcriptional regulator [Thermohalobacter berrensis]RKD28808.1 sigma-54-dependent Fis family transcriptional regulator [Thermohalobacter berrensis]
MKAYIKKSHERCKKIGLDVNRKYSKTIINGGELQKRLEKNKDLILTAKPIINQLYNFVKGSNFFAILTDEEGCILNVIGDEKILSEAFSLKMVPGAFMNEENIGTNAMAVALKEGMPVQVSGSEHFIKAYHRWTCSAAPIKNNEGKIIGTLDLTGYSEFVHSHTLGMVVAAVNAISKMLEIKKYTEKLEMAKIYTETVVDSIHAGILTSDLHGNIKTVNKYVTKMFGYSVEEMKQKKIWELFDGWERVKETVLSNCSFLDNEVFINARRNKLQFNLSVYPILDNNDELKHLVFVFKEVKKVRKLANKIMGRQAIYTFDKIIGKNKDFIKVVEFAKKIADSRSTILITGESGTGKEIFAQSIHNYSDRREEPFVPINCGAIPKNLIESELFGYEEGAFTGAKKRGHPGKFEIADGGTIFLDEIGEMPLDMQTRLLRVIEEGTVSRIGSTKEIVVNVRIIAATNKDLYEEVKKGNFRKDLFYRLNVLPIKLPALRERKDDIPLLIEYFIKRKSKKLNKRRIKISNEHMEYLINYEWPGNIRELENYVELLINTEGITDFTYKNNRTIKLEFNRKNIYEELTLEEVEKRHIINMLKKYEGNITKTAKVLGIGRNTLYRKIKKYKIDCAKMEHRSVMERKI